MRAQKIYYLKIKLHIHKHSPTNGCTADGYTLLWHTSALDFSAVVKQCHGIDRLLWKSSHRNVRWTMSSNKMSNKIIAPALQQHFDSTHLVLENSWLHFWHSFNNFSCQMQRRIVVVVSVARCIQSAYNRNRKPCWNFIILYIRENRKQTKYIYSIGSGCFKIVWLPIRFRRFQNTHRESSCR